MLLLQVIAAIGRPRLLFEMAGLRLRTAYLLAYNIIQFAGWAAVLAQLAPLIGSSALDGAYVAAGSTVGKREVAWVRPNSVQARCSASRGP